MDNSAMFKIGYGLYVLTTRIMGQDNGCIINTVMQVTDNPLRILIAVNKQNKSHEMLQKTGIFNISVLSEKADFEIFKRFGFQSGKDVNKFPDDKEPRANNTLKYIEEGANAYISGLVISETDLGTHTLFLAEVTDAKVLNDDTSATYDYYHKHIKPKPEVKSDGKGVKYVCKICGYVYEGDPLPDDYVCPLCKHGAADFERIEE